MVVAAELTGPAGFLIWLIGAIVVGGAILWMLGVVLAGVIEFVTDAWPLVLGVLVVGGIGALLVYYGVEW